MPLISTQHHRVQSSFTPLHICNSLLKHKKKWLPLSSIYMLIFSKYLIDTFTHLLDLPLHIKFPSPARPMHILLKQASATTRVPSHYIQVCIIAF